MAQNLVGDSGIFNIFSAEHLLSKAFASLLCRQAYLLQYLFPHICSDCRYSDTVLPAILHAFSREHCSSFMIFSMISITWLALPSDLLSSIISLMAWHTLYSPFPVSYFFLFSPHWRRPASPPCPAPGSPSGLPISAFHIPDSRNP